MEIDTVSTAQVVLGILLGIAGITFAILCLVFNFYFRKKRYLNMHDLHTTSNWFLSLSLSLSLALSNNITPIYLSFISSALSLSFSTSNQDNHNKSSNVELSHHTGSNYILHCCHTTSHPHKGQISQSSLDHRSIMVFIFGILLLLWHNHHEDVSCILHCS